MTRASPSWTDEETELARANYDLLKPAEFLQKVGRTKQAAKSHFKYIDKPGVRERMNAQKVALRLKQKEWLDKMAARQPEGPPAEVIQDAIRRATAPRSVTAWFCGDPAPGYSALERRT